MYQPQLLLALPFSCLVVIHLSSFLTFYSLNLQQTLKILMGVSMRIDNSEDIENEVGNKGVWNAGREHEK